MRDAWSQLAEAEASELTGGGEAGAGIGKLEFSEVEYDPLHSAAAWGNTTALHFLLVSNTQHSNKALILKISSENYEPYSLLLR